MDLGRIAQVVSLTSVLKSDTALAARLGRLVGSTSSPRRGELQLRAPPQTTNYSLVGTAFDYLFRFDVERMNPRARKRPWVASTAVDLLKPAEIDGSVVVPEWPGVQDLATVADEASNILASARLAHDHFLTVRDPTEEQLRDLASHALRLAKLDVIFRAGIIDSRLGDVDPGDVRDLLNLRALVPFDSAMGPCLGDDVWLNPVFGRFSRGIQGADADVVAGDLLVDIKTTKNPDLRPHLAQLVGYSMLAEAYRAEESPEFPRIEKIAAYFSRQGTLVSVPLESARRNPDYSQAFEALMVYCRQQPLTLNNLRTQKAQPARASDQGTPTRDASQGPPSRSRGRASKASR